MIYFVGDIHGDFKGLFIQLTELGIKNSIFIQVGDFGVGFKRSEEQELELINNFLNKQNNQFYVIRGNHDNPSYFATTVWKGNICFVKDYSILEVENHKILLVGGSISIDRTNRVVGSNYWEDEIFLYNEDLLNDALQHVDKLDIVVTHNAPTEFWPYYFGKIVYDFLDRDKILLEGLKNERNAHSKLLKHLESKRLSPKFWYYGHFHASHESLYNSIRYRLLDSSEIFPHFL